MSEKLPGIHHVTAIAGNAQRNVDFYAGTLGLRLVKKTVNFDDQYTYHLYYGDGLGRPGTILTFFPWNAAKKGRMGSGQIFATFLAIPKGSTAYWQDRLTEKGLTITASETSLNLQDPDGLSLTLVEAENDNREGWTGSEVPKEYAIRGIHGVALLVVNEAASASLLSETLGFIGDNGYYSVSDSPGSSVCLLQADVQGQMGVGVVHHVAFRTPDETTLLAWREELIERGLHVTKVMDRNYFRSIYFREPGGVLYEIATDPPGFTVDESLETLGTALKLPASLEPNRAAIERGLPKLIVPGV